jgi:hypothetical protein
MALINEGGKLLLRDGKLGTGQGCCCGGPCNPSTCPTGTECTPPCVCQNGECKPACDPQECPTGTECTPPCVCQNGECKPACDPQECPNGTECTPPCVCVDGQCVPGCSGPCDEENPCPDGCVCFQGTCLPACDSGGNGCPEGYLCCPQLVDVVNNSAVILNVCLPLGGPEGQCCFNFGANCNPDSKTFAECFCTHPQPYNNETIWIEGLSCDDACGNPFP